MSTLRASWSRLSPDEAEREHERAQVPVQASGRLLAPRSRPPLKLCLQAMDLHRLAIVFA